MGIGGGHVVVHLLASTNLPAFHFGQQTESSIRLQRNWISVTIKTNCIQRSKHLHTRYPIQKYDIQHGYQK